MIARSHFLAIGLVFASSHTALPHGDKKELPELQGTWKLVSVHSDDELAADDIDKMPRWVIKGTKVIYGGEELAVLAVDATTTPRSIDLGMVNPKRVLEGIYAVEGDKLKICVSVKMDGVKERPVDFATADKPGRRLFVFEKAKPGEGIDGEIGFVGVALSRDRETKQISVGMVLPGSPAQKAGLKKDDVLVKVGADAPTDLRNAVDLVRQNPPGSQLIIRVRRDGKEQDIKVRVGVVPFYFLN